MKKCRCCGRSDQECQIDYHHWDYQTNAGVHLCRKCHTFIHDGKRALEQTDELPHGENWKIPASNRMVGLHEKIHGRCESWEDFFKRYQIPMNEDYEHIFDLEL